MKRFYLNGNKDSNMSFEEYIVYNKKGDKKCQKT